MKDRKDKTLKELSDYCRERRETLGSKYNICCFCGYKNICGDNCGKNFAYDWFKDENNSNKEKE